MKSTAEVSNVPNFLLEGHPVEFNLSAKSVVDPDMLAIVRAAFETHGVSPELVVCELTETALVRDTPGAEAFVRGLSDIGCKVALDDFGAGYCGFAYLKRLSVSFLKIDQQFVTDLANEASSRHVVSAVVNLARAFSMRTIAEGVEDDVTLEILKELGVDFAQGFFIGPPGPAADTLGRGVGESRESSTADPPADGYFAEATPTTGLFNTVPPMDPLKFASP